MLQISKPNKSIDIIFQTEDAADFFINQHIEIRGKPLPFIRKAKRILKVVIKGVHPEMSNDLLLSELYDYIDHTSSIRNSDRQYNGTTLYDGTKQVFVTHLTRHIPRSIKIGNRWCLVFYKDQPVLPRRPPRVSTIVATPASEEPPHNMELEAPGPDASASESDANSEHSKDSPKITDEPMPEVSLTSKRVREPEETGKETTETKKKKQESDIEFESCREHLRVIIDELESSNFENIREVLGMEPSVHVVDAIGTMIAMAGSTRGGDMPCQVTAGNFIKNEEI